MTGVFLVLLYFFLAAVAELVILQPERFLVQRSTVINAPPKKIFAIINDLKKWKDWSPWAESDATAQISYSKILSVLALKFNGHTAKKPAQAL